MARTASLMLISETTRARDASLLFIVPHFLDVVPPDDPGNATVDFHGEKRSNQTHASKTDPDAKMARKGKGKEAKLSYNGNLLVENRHE
jgi:hypothetical protein